MSKEKTRIQEAYDSITRPKVLLGILVIAALSGVVVGSVTLNTTDTRGVFASHSEMNDSTNLSVGDVRVNYSGLTAEDVYVDVKNFDNTNHTANISMVLKNGSKEVQSMKKVNVSLANESTTTVRYDTKVQILDFDIINVLVKDTGI